MVKKAPRRAPRETKYTVQTCVRFSEEQGEKLQRIQEALSFESESQVLRWLIDRCDPRKLP